MIPDAEETFLGAIQAVGEKLPFSFTKNTDCTVSVEFNYDLLVDGNYILTNLRAIKTVSGIAPDSLLTVGIYSVSPGSNAVSSENILAQCYIDANMPCGVVGIAGDPNAIHGTPAVAGQKQSSMLYGNGDVNDPALAFINSIPSRTGSSRQRLRIKINAVVGNGQQFNPSCLIVAEFISVGATYINNSTELIPVRVRW